MGALSLEQGRRPVAVDDGEDRPVAGPPTGRVGPRMVAPAATADLDLNRRSLDRLATIDAEIVLPGHGDPWLHGAANAARLAHRASRA